MEFFETIEARKSSRRFTDEKVPEEVMHKAFNAAILAPNSSNTQTWNFYWAKSLEVKKKVVEACLSQSAARNAQEVIVVTANPKLWKRSRPQILEYLKEIKAPKPVFLYYEKLIPFTYTSGPFNLFYPIKFISAFITGLFRPIPRGPFTKNDINTVAIKSAALACENFALAITALGFDTCMMEGFDERRMKKALNLKWGEKVVMAISVGKASEDATWGPRFRIPTEEVVHIR